MSTTDSIIGLFLRVDSMLVHISTHPQAQRSSREVLTRALLFARTGVGPRACSRCIKHHDRGWFPGLPLRTRLFRMFATPAEWAAYCLAQPTTWGVADTYGIAWIHPWREDRADLQLGRTGRSKHRWIIGAKLAYVGNQDGLSVAGDDAAANAPDNAFPDLSADFQDEMVGFTETRFHAAAGDPPTQKACKRGTWTVRMVVATVLSMLTTVCHLQQASQRTWSGVRARLAYTMAVFNMLVLWDGIPVDEHGKIHLSIAEFSL